MRHVALASAGALAIVLLMIAAPSLAAECGVAPGGRVMLASDAVDPDVFLWDSRVRLVDYAAGQWGNTRAIFAHTVLAEPGTLAMIVSCVRAVAHPKFGNGDEDAIGVKVTSGPHRGRYGWVLSSDIHLKRMRAFQGSLVGTHTESKR